MGWRLSLTIFAAAFLLTRLYGNYVRNTTFYELVTPDRAIIYVGRVARYHGVKWDNTLDYDLIGPQKHIPQWFETQEEDDEISSVPGAVVLARALYREVNPSAAQIKDVENMIEIGMGYDYELETRSENQPGDVNIYDEDGNIVNYAVLGSRPRVVPPIELKAQVTDSAAGSYDEKEARIEL